jgi:hypothetical protein
MHENSVGPGMWWSGGKAQWYPYVQFHVCISDGVLEDIKVRCSVLKVLHCDLIISCYSWTNLDIIFIFFNDSCEFRWIPRTTVTSCRCFLPLLANY